MIQGLRLGGEYGGAITYVAEHVSDERRGYYTGWVQTSPTFGIVVSLFVIIATRTYFGNELFDAWAWRIPFLISFLLVAIAIYIRLQLQETPIFEEIKAKGQDDQKPLERGLPQLEYQIHTDRHHRADRAGSGLVQRSVLGLVLPAAGLQYPLTTAYIVGAALFLATPSLILARTRAAARARWFRRKKLVGSYLLFRATSLG